MNDNGEGLYRKGKFVSVKDDVEVFGVNLLRRSPYREPEGFRRSYGGKRPEGVMGQIVWILLRTGISSVPDSNFRIEMLNV